MRLSASTTPSDSPAINLVVTMPGETQPETAKMFVYGTLLVEDIVERVLGRPVPDLEFQDALLEGYTRHQVKNEDYPGIIDANQLDELMGADGVGHLSADERNSRGAIISGLTARDLTLLDVFEGNEYKRVQVKAYTTNDPATDASLPLSTKNTTLSLEPPNTPKSAWTVQTVWLYQWSAPVKRLEPHPWDISDFLHTKAALWASSNNHEFDEVVARRALDAKPPTAYSGPDADGVVGKTMEGYPDFGHNMLSQWTFAKGYVNLNHGSYGSAPVPLIAKRKVLSEYIESKPDQFMRLELEPGLEKVRAAVAPLINASADEVVLTPNATHGVNTVTFNIRWEAGDVIVVYSTTYDAVSQTAKFVCDRYPGVEIAVVQLTFPCSHAEVLRKTEEVLAKYNEPLPGWPSWPRDKSPTPSGKSADKRVRLVLVDGIASVPGVQYPWEGVVGLAHKYGALSLVDAAHSIGQHKVDVQKSHPDFFVSNCHKWLMTHRSAAIIYVPKRNQHLIRSSFPTGHYYESEKYPMEGHAWTFASQFSWNGTSDFTPYFSIADAIEFRRSIGGEARIMAHNHSLAVAGAKYLAKRWGTTFMETENGELTACMSNVQLPNLPLPTCRAEEGKMMKYIFAQFTKVHNCYFGVYVHDGKWWGRFSAQVWNEVGDFEYVAGVYEAVAEEIRKGTHLQTPQTPAQ